MREPGQIIADVRRYLTWERIAEFGRTMVWVAPLTILIWVYAEREQIARGNDVPLRIRIRTASPAANRLAVRPFEHEVTMDLEGPKVRLDALRQRILNLPSAELEIDYSPKTAGPISQHTIDLLNDQPFFSDSGVKVTAASPADITVMSDTVETKTLTVVADGNGAMFEGTPTFEPATVTLSGPGAVIRRIAQKTIRADLSQSNLLAVPGAHEVADALLVLPQSPGNDPSNPRLVVSPEKVKCTFKIRARDVTYTIPALPVYTLAPAGFSDAYQATFDPVVTNVVVQGSPDLIAGLQGDRKPKAILEYSAADLPAGKRITRKLRFELPEGLTLSPESASTEVTFTLSPRVVLPGR